MARGEAAWAVTDSIKVLMDGPRTAQRPALTAVPCLSSCESRLCIMAHMVRCATVSALSCGAPCVTDVVYCVALLGARAPSARPRRRRRERHENRNRVSETVHLKHDVHRNVYAATYSRTAARRAQPEMHYCELSTCWQSRASPTADPAQRQERQHGPPHSSRTPKAPEHCPPSASTRRCLWWLSGQVLGRCCRVERVSRVAQRMPQ